MAYLRCTGAPGGSLKLRTAQGEIASFETNLPEPYQSVTVNVVATGGNGTPDNPIPINGYSSANIQNVDNAFVPLWTADNTFRGHITFNQLAVSGAGTGNHATIAYNSDTKTYTVTPTEYTDNSTGMYNVIPASDGTVGHKYLAIFDAFVDFAVDFSFGFTPRITSSTITANVWTQIGGVCSYESGSFAIYARVRNAGWSSGTYKLKNVQVFDLTEMFGDTIANYISALDNPIAFFKAMFPEDYYSYDSGTSEIIGTNLATIAFGQTVYGGVLDVTRGKLTVTWKIVNPQTSSWAVNSAENHIFVTTFSDIMPTGIEYSDRQEGAICSHYSADTQYSISQNMHNETWLRLSKQFFIRNNAYSNVNDFVASLSGVMLAYVLKTPFDIDLTPVQIRALVGENNVFADCGETEVEYLEVE